MRQFCWLFSIFIIISSISANEPDIEFKAATVEESLFIRRIIEFYQEDEAELFLNQVQEFLNQYPKSPLCQDLFALLGDFYMEKKDYDNSVKYFSKIHNKKIQSKIIINYLQALYNLKKHDLILITAHKYLTFFSKDNKDSNDSIHFFYAEALYKKSIESNLSEENKAKMALQAMREYESLINSRLSVQSMNSLAHLYYRAKKFNLSATTYLKLAEKDSDNKEFYLFQNAIITAKFDKEKAIQAFELVCNFKSELASSAAYNQMVLLYDLKRYKELILAKDQISSLLSKDKSLLLNFFLGRAHLEREDCQRAEFYLKEFLKTDTPNEEYKIALLSLAEIASKNKDTNLLNEVLALYEKFYKDPKEYLDLLLVSAVFSKNQKDYAKAEDSLKKALELNIEQVQKANIEFEYAHILFLNKKWPLSREKFIQFLNDYNDHKDNLLAVHYLLASSSELLKENDDKFRKIDFCHDIEKVLKMDFVKNSNKLDKYLFLLAKAYFENNDYKKTVKTLKPILKRCESKEIFTETLLLNGYALKKLSAPPSKYLVFFDKALKLNPNHKESGKIHLILYNGFLKLQEKDEKKYFSTNAADHLYEAFALKETILRDNLIWASNYFLKEQKDYKKSIYLLEGAIKLKDFSLTAKELEEELIILSRLYLENKFTNEHINLLDKLEKEYLKYPDFNWKYVQEVRYELAKNYELQKQFDKAVMYYDEVFHHGPHLRGYLQAKSCLQSARIRLALINNENCKKNNPEIVKILYQLKDLTIQKSLENEPVHLEAAIEYIDLLCRIENLSSISKKKLSLLEKMKQSFTSSDTIVDREYHDKRKSNEIKNQIFEDYMKLLDSEIILCKKDTSNLNEVLSSMKSLIKQINITDFLKTRIQNNLKKLQTSNLDHKSKNNES
jgi:tetratricopeptide (TPR) repeat protein